jgi:hypothetical protein
MYVPTYARFDMGRVLCTVRTGENYLVYSVLHDRAARINLPTCTLLCTGMYIVHLFPKTSDFRLLLCTTA